MTGESDLASLGALVGDRVRAALLLRLLDGGATTASELAAAAGASASLTSSHLRRLLEGGLVSVTTSGRHRLYRLAGVEVAEMLEAMQLVAPETPVTSLRGERSRRRLRRARLCYDHLAGVLGTAVTDGLVTRGAVVLADGAALGERAEEVLGEVGLDLAPLRARERRLLRECTDWTERRPHLAGAVGAAVATRMIDSAWVVRRPGSRGLDVTADGAAGLEEWLGLRLRDLDGWRETAPGLAG
ncbi:helix-turn-helix domain-containing protein [Nocardioides sp. SYSU D00038]|uniref:helix-turn-helix domain-containing protein n=1 Tax=Nocardioides sp. SYSU D00038 TaxID=2812554 RepID=UPI0019673FF6|nr:helix-turn-helix domain-containing protein [Nocardioides sp. SYSU D00038]